MPRTDKQNKVIRAQRRTALKKAALECFAEYGYGHTSVQMIADKAGVSKGLIYNYYDSKNALLKAVLDDAIETGKMFLRILDSSDVEPGEKLLLILDGVFAMMDADLDKWKFFTSLAMQKEIRKELEVLIIEQNELQLKKFEELFEQLGVEDPMLEAYFIGAFIDGIFLDKAIIQEYYPYAEIKEKLRKFIIKRYKL